MTDKTLIKRVDDFIVELDLVASNIKKNHHKDVTIVERYNRSERILSSRKALELLQEQQARIEELEKEQQWQPIESFNRDAEGFNCFVLFKDPIDSKKGIFHAGYYHDNGISPAGFKYWHDASVIRNPTHWKPLQPLQEGE